MKQKTYSQGFLEGYKLAISLLEKNLNSLQTAHLIHIKELLKASERLEEGD